LFTGRPNSFYGSSQQRFHHFPWRGPCTSKPFGPLVSIEVSPVPHKCRTAGARRPACQIPENMASRLALGASSCTHCPLHSAAALQGGSCWCGVGVLPRLRLRLRLRASITAERCLNLNYCVIFKIYILKTFNFFKTTFSKLSKLFKSSRYPPDANTQSEQKFDNVQICLLCLL
jgi:hypothetical protein